MDVALEGKEPLDVDADCTVFGVLERTEKDALIPPHLKAADSATGGFLSAAWERKEIKGKKAEVLLFPLPGGRRRIALVGLSKPADLSIETVRRAIGYLTRHLKGKGIRSLCVDLPSFTAGKLPPEDCARAIADGHALASYEFTRYKSERTEPEKRRLVISLSKEHVRVKDRVGAAVSREGKLLDTVLWTRDLANLPADTATPEFLANQAAQLGKDVKLKVTIFDEKKLKEMGCGGILAVGGGSIHPPRMAILEYTGAGGRNAKTIAVVGKGITFDSGGISIKPSTGMSEMKFDKSGAVAVLGILRAAAELKLKVNVIGVMALAENLPGGSSYRPGDIVKTFSGKTIEVLNTDAEGRVVLSDALSYVATKYSPDQIVDLATLTGACVVALGNDIAGLLSTDDHLAAGLLASSEATGEHLWRLPLTQTHKDMVRGEVGDVRNSTEMPMAGTLTAGAFLSEFVAGKPWAHLDIAGTAWVAKAPQYSPSYTPSGATAFGVRLLIHYLESLG